MQYSPVDIARVTKAKMKGSCQAVISHIVTDSRRINWPASSMFVALAGLSRDGHQFIAEAFEKGIRVFLVHQYDQDWDSFEHACFIHVTDTLHALHDLASYHRQMLDGQFLAITGSNGKTMVKEWMAQIAQAFIPVSKSPQSYNSQLGVPLSVLRIDRESELHILEAGISHPGDMNTLERIINPNLGFITNIGQAHQENFSSLSEKIKEKLSLFKHSHKVYYCRDSEELHVQATTILANKELVSWGFSDGSDLIISETIESNHSTQISGVFKEKNCHLKVPFTTPSSVHNLILIWLWSLDNSLDQDLFQSQVNRLEPVAMRLEQKVGKNGCTLINDYYNSDLESISSALDLLQRQTSQATKTVIISDVLQSGIPAEKLYRKVNDLLVVNKVNRIIAVGPDISHNASCFTLPVESFSGTEQLISTFNSFSFNNEAILLKGARSFAFERISQLLEERVHSTVLEISMKKLHNNLSVLRKQVNPDTKLMVMVKASSYGSGGYELARYLESEKVDYLGVAIVDEGIELRKSGIKTPILVMNPDFQQSDLILEYHLEPEIYNLSGLNSFCSFVRRAGMENYPVHLKIDTGMHRLGFDHKELDQAVAFVKDHPEILVRSIFSHLAAAENPAHDTFTKTQISRFNKSCEQFTDVLPHPFLKHILNTAGIERFPEAQFDMVRTGIGLYGFSQNAGQEFFPIATLKTKVSQIHHLDAGETVGYGRTVNLEEPATIAVIPIGYADGLDRRLGNGNYSMIIRGTEAKTTGQICMDLTMLDITGIEAVEGDEVIVFGPENDVSKMSELLGTIPYEILTSIPPRVKRTYLFE